MYHAFLQHLCDPTDTITQANVLNAAELTVAAENARAQLLAGHGDVEQLVRLENLASRAVRRLGIKSGAPDKPKPGEALSRHLARLADLSAAPDVAGPSRQLNRAKPRGEALPGDNA